MVLRASNHHILWQKERLLNLLCERLPPEYRYVAWVDGDIIFRDRNWVTKALAAMRHYDIIQPWERAEILGADGREDRIIESVCSPRGVHPGYAWVCRREVFPLYDACVIGSADGLMAQTWGLHRDTKAPNFFQQPNPWSEHSERWGERQRGWRLGNLRGVIDHLWHGRWQDRHYRKRLVKLTNLGFNPESDLALDGGIWRWKRRDHAALLYSYFTRRREDD